MFLALFLYYRRFSIITPLKRTYYNAVFPWTFLNLLLYPVLISTHSLVTALLCSTIKILNNLKDSQSRCFLDSFTPESLIKSRFFLFIVTKHWHFHCTDLECLIPLYSVYSELLVCNYWCSLVRWRCVYCTEQGRWRHWRDALKEALCLQ